MAAEVRTVLLVDPEPGTRAGLVDALARGGFGVDVVRTGEAALARLERGGIDLLVTELRLPGTDGLALIQAMRRTGMRLPAVVVTAHGTVEGAVAAMKLGAFDFLTEPVSPTELLSVARWAIAVAAPAVRRSGCDRRALGSPPEPAAPVARDSTAAGIDEPERSVPRLGGFQTLTVREVERRLILETLARTGDNRTRAATLLGISIRTLRNKLAAYRARGELELAVATGA
jgi:DNA-binding NtrC family response regulator